MLFTALLLAAATPCATLSGPIDAAGAFFNQADSAISKRDMPDAKTAYQSGMQQLAGTPWFIDDKSCDPPHYTFERYVTTLHSLDVAIGSGEMQPMDAYVTQGDMYKQLVKALPPDSFAYFYRTYGDLAKQGWQYTDAIAKAAHPEIVAAHNPAGPGCKYPNLDAEVLNQAMPEYPDIARTADIAEATVKAKVRLNESGGVTEIRITKSSGNMALDQAALAAARQSSYLPAIADCKRVPGTFDFNVTFQPNG
jgi:TonB family protein